MKKVKNATSADADFAPAELLTARLVAGVRAVEHAPPPGARDQRMLTGVARDGHFVVPPEVAIRAGIDALRGSGRVYSYGNTVVLDTTAAGGPELVPLRAEARVEPAAAGLLANLMFCEGPGKEGPEWFALPGPYLQVLLNAEPLVEQLPRIDLYARRPLFGPGFELLNPGYHPGPRYLIHGAAIEPDVEPLQPAVEPLARLPKHLRVLLAGFCFRGPADLTNALALLLTGVLVNHFTIGGKPVALIDGNQPGLGKTLLARVVGVILDGIDPQLIHYTPDDDELQKRICATLRPNRQSVVLIDNAKSPTGTPISSPAVESNSMAPEISLRILGVSQNYVRPNNAIWALTMNQTRVSPDLVSRGLPIRLEHAGDPRNRTFGHPDPITYAREHRPDLLGELAGFVVRWSQQGRPRGTQSHRLHAWAEVLGGILTANGFPDFLTNYDEAASAFDSELEELSNLAEIVIAAPNGPYVSAGPNGCVRTNNGAAERAVPAGQWVPFLERAGVLGDTRAKAIAAGKYLSAKVGRAVDVAANSRTGTATLRVAKGRARENKYWFEVVWQDATPAGHAEHVPDPVAHGPPDEAVSSPETLVPAPPPTEPPHAPAPEVKGGNAEEW